MLKQAQRKLALIIVGLEDLAEQVKGGKVGI